MIEIEKTFFVKDIPFDLSLFPSEIINQGYISSPPSPLRIRQKGSKFELTKKIPLKNGDFSSAEEINIDLTQYEFDKLWSLVEKSLEKIRYYIPLQDNLIAEINVYQRNLNGLIFVEVEFSSSEEMDHFVPPSWFGADVTQEDFSANSFLAGKNFKEVEPFIKLYE